MKELREETGDRRSAKDASVVTDRHGFIVAFAKQHAHVETAVCHFCLKVNGMIIYHIICLINVVLYLLQTRERRAFSEA
jgi:hypothetical protein